MGREGLEMIIYLPLNFKVIVKPYTEFVSIQMV